MNLFSLFSVKYFFQVAFVVYLVINPFQCSNIAIIAQSLVAYIALILFIRSTAYLRFFLKVDTIENIIDKLKKIQYLKLIYESDTKLIFKQNNSIVKYYPNDQELKIYSTAIFKEKIMDELTEYKYNQ